MENPESKFLSEIEADTASGLGPALDKRLSGGDAAPAANAHPERDCCLLCQAAIRDGDVANRIFTPEGCAVAYICEPCGDRLTENQKNSYVRACDQAIGNERFLRNQDRQHSLAVLEALQRKITDLWMERERLESGKITFETALAAARRETEYWRGETSDLRGWIAWLGCAAALLAAAWIIFG